ncbi:MAG: dethiobiotin synthase [Elusimicrobia bacterium]|nr:dethiobiotin synthase [Elusimicrobiota bacterium]
MHLQLTKGIFITATGTGVGKTFLACAIARRLRQKGVDVGVMKPVVSGGISDTLALKRAAQAKEGLDLISPIRYKKPLAPYSASFLEKKKFSLKKALSAYRKIRKSHSCVIVEGSGGVRVPLSPSLEMADLMVHFQLPVIVVVSAKLGTINHTLLTLDYLSRKKIKVLGIVLNFYDPRSIVDRTNLKFFQDKKIPILAVLPSEK